MSRNMTNDHGPHAAHHDWKNVRKGKVPQIMAQTRTHHRRFTPLQVRLAPDFID